MPLVSQDDSKSIDREEVAELVRSLRLMVGDHNPLISPAELSAAMAEMDEDGNEEIDFEEFFKVRLPTPTPIGVVRPDCLDRQLGRFECPPNQPNPPVAGGTFSRCFRCSFPRSASRRSFSRSTFRTAPPRPASPLRVVRPDCLDRQLWRSEWH